MLAAAVVLPVEAARAAIVVPVVVEAAVDPLVSGTCTSFWQLPVGLLEVDPAILCVSDNPLLESRRLRVRLCAELLSVKLSMELPVEGTYLGNLPRRLYDEYERS